jgi:hypothetical protein
MWGVLMMEDFPCRLQDVQNDEGVMMGLDESPAQLL